MSTDSNTDTDLTPFVRLALACVEREYPNQVSILLRSPGDLRLPAESTPAFRGCFDWHSAVHSHWLLVRALATGAAPDLHDEVRAVLARNLTPANVAAELRHLRSRPAFERPYGLAWLLQLATELTEWEDAAASPLADALAPLVDVARSHLERWLPKLSRPVRSGVHSQTAFALGLALDHARVCDDPAFELLLVSRSRAYFADDRDYAVHLEPSGEDFLSPALGAADLMRRVLPSDDFAAWLTRVLPSLPETAFAPQAVTDRTDGRLSHLDGLNLSRAWMLEGIASHLPGDDARAPQLAAAAQEHRSAGLAAVTDEHYETAHWLGSFATYLVTRRGLAAG